MFRKRCRCDREKRYSLFFTFLAGLASPLAALFSEVLVSLLPSEFDFDDDSADLLSASAFFLYDSLR